MPLRSGSGPGGPLPERSGRRRSGAGADISAVGVMGAIFEGFINEGFSTVMCSMNCLSN